MRPPDALRRIVVLLLAVCRTVLAQFAEQGMGGGGAVAPLLESCPGRWQWTCKNGECIALYDVCDGIVQCSDGSDEWNCQDIKAARQQQKPGKPAVASTTTTTTPAPVILAMTSHQIVVFIGAFVLLSALVVFIIRRRAIAKRRALARNRRGTMSALDDDSDEEVLISSLYS